MTMYRKRHALGRLFNVEDDYLTTFVRKNDGILSALRCADN